MQELISVNNYTIKLFYNYSIECKNKVVNFINREEIVLKNVERFNFVKIDSGMYLFLKTKSSDKIFVYELAILELRKIFEITFKDELCMDEYYIGIKTNDDSCFIRINDFSSQKIPDEKYFADNIIKNDILDFKKDSKFRYKIIVYGSSFDFIDFKELFSGIEI